MDNASLVIVIQSFLWVIMLASWTIQVAGLGRNTWLCMDAQPDDPAVELECGWQRSQEWWSVALQFVALVVSILSIFKIANKGYSVFIVSISILQLTFVAHKYVAGGQSLGQNAGQTRDDGYWPQNLRRIYKDPTGMLLTPMGDSVQAIVAGTIAELVTNYIWLLSNAYFEAPSSA